MFLTRLISGAVLVLAAIFLFVFGNMWLLAALGLLSVVGNYELLRVFDLQKHPLGIVTYVATIAYYVCFIPPDRYSAVWLTGFLLPIFLLVLLVIYVIRYPKDKIDSVAKCLLVFLYVSVSLSFIYQTRGLTQGQWLVWLIIMGSWGSDTCAYCVGMLIGKHHFSELSPKKTIEGCVGGVIGAGIIGFVYSFFYPMHIVGGVKVEPRILFPIITAVCAAISQVGDLAASAVKRNYKVKDYGRIIPGHGGVMDRFDSVIFVAPFVYYLLFVFMFY